MARRRNRKPAAPIHLSAGPLPERLMTDFAGYRLLFTDASRLRHGGLSVVLYADPASEPAVFTRSVALDGSNKLELQAAVFGLEQASRLYPGQAVALFSDNRDALAWLAGIQSSPPCEPGNIGAAGIPGTALHAQLAHTTLHWIKGHGRCRGNALADRHARLAAGGVAGFSL